MRAHSTHTHTHIRTYAGARAQADETSRLVAELDSARYHAAALELKVVRRAGRALLHPCVCGVGREAAGCLRYAHGLLSWTRRQAATAHLQHAVTRSQHVASGRNLLHPVASCCTLCTRRAQPSVSARKVASPARDRSCGGPVPATNKQTNTPRSKTRRNAALGAWQEQGLLSAAEAAAADLARKDAEIDRLREAIDRLKVVLTHTRAHAHARHVDTDARPCKGRHLPHPAREGRACTDGIAIARELLSCTYLHPRARECARGGAHARTPQAHTCARVRTLAKTSPHSLHILTPAHRKRPGPADVE